jgi:hypothetical protein
VDLWSPLRRRSLSSLSERFDSAEARTRLLCQQQPEQTQVRKVLLALEKDVHLNEGWDAPVRVFVLLRNRHSRRVSALVLRALSDAIMAAPTHKPRALDAFADVAVWLRQLRDGGDVDAAPPNADFFREAIASIAPMRDTGDLFDFGLGQEFHGFGFLMEAWMTNLQFDPDDPEEVALAVRAAELMKSGELSTHPMSIEVRQIEYSARDGWSWAVMRPRRTATIAVPRACYVHTDEDDFRFSGTVIEATTRICNALASNTVPVRRDLSEEFLRHYPT